MKMDFWDLLEHKVTRKTVILIIILLSTPFSSLKSRTLVPAWTDLWMIGWNRNVRFDS